MAVAAPGCICGRRFMQTANEGTCLSCGHGDPEVHPCMTLPHDMRRLPRDLGALLRSGRRLSPVLYQNVRR